ncbi:mycothiol conjugate amidase Mca [Sediminivirga luteola]|uniref:mycothiol conjugate amidase Mca n=1 Tax=Sediminivirga luteola TaxID=1774748 RepID=UPI001F57EE91|nr:mycothiol conjugate amidase Mca [Sediminivirga luteola]MCI2267041.1 mycothiol conjugate amidase Mca [Sediminivirga luteola]
MTPGQAAERPYEGLRLMAVHAHPDDESSKGAATTARYTAQGARVLIVSCTGGEGGSILNPAMNSVPKASRDMAGLRRVEMAAAAEALGAEHLWLGHVDGGLPEGDFDTELPPGCFYRVPTDVAMRPLLKAIRDFRPHVLTTYDENGGYPHPDHIKTHQISMAAVDAAGQADIRPELGEPWQVQKVYYNQDFHLPKMRALDTALREAGEESPFEEMLRRIEERAKDEKRREQWLSTSVHCAEYFPQRARALLAHATQIDPNGGFFAVSQDVHASVWPTEEFELALDRTGRPPLPREDFVETDLFAGVRDDEGRMH